MTVISAKKNELARCVYQLDTRVGSRGRPRVLSTTEAIDKVLFVCRTGCQWSDPSITFGKAIEDVLKERTVADDSSVRPILPVDGQRLVAIDPGRRDLIAAVTPEGERFKVSLKSFRHNAGTKRCTSYTQRLLEGHTCCDGRPLLRKMEGLPCRRNLDEWTAYTSAIIPLLGDIASAYKTRGLRRWRFRAYQLRDRTLDQICSKITGKSSQPVLVAFGSANTPAPQGSAMLQRHRVGFAGDSLEFMEPESA